MASLLSAPLPACVCPQANAGKEGARSASFLRNSFLGNAKLSAVVGPKHVRARTVCAEASHENQLNAFTKKVAAGMFAVGLSASLQFSPACVDVAMAGETNILNAGAQASHFFDDAGVISKVTKSDLKKLLDDVEQKTGYHLDIVTIRKLTAKADAFEFADAVLETWYPTVEIGDKKGVLVLVTTLKEGAVSGGPAFNNAVGDAVLEGVVSENLPVLATEEKYNEALYSSARRIANAIQGLPDVAGPKVNDNKQVSNYKTREETEDKRGVFITTVGGLLVIAFVVPMVQYFAYTKK